ncbi:unnamed protein product [Linum tenue]|uniref:Ionotropic glutamate receptor C-terminal domain-containing protein n=1 Tax=Linum tenue TaxID=586396 RepID=A0AAV0JQH4_9ROSI|nr:unnamed protein product [Linum tenue]
MITSTEAAVTNPSTFRIGAIVDETSRIGKEQILAMQMAAKDFQDPANQSLVLDMYITDSKGEPLQAALSAQELVNSSQVKAIVGPCSWEETSLVAQIATKNQIPLLSFADSTPRWARERWPFLIQASSSKSAQMKAIAAIIQSWNWHQVSVITEDVESSTKAVLQLSTALRQVNVQLVDVITLPPSSNPSLLSHQLESLKVRPCRVFVVHLSSSTALAEQLFRTAMDMKMLERDYVWITTHAFTSLLHTFHPSTISAMQGVIGVKGHFRETKPRYQSFSKRFRRRFSSAHPDESNHEPSIFAVEAYDAVWALALSLLRPSNVTGGQEDLLNKLLLCNFNGLVGNVQFTVQKAGSLNTFEVINVIGKSYNGLGLWTDGHGFSENTVGEEETATYFSSMRDIMGHVIWPGRPRYSPKGWTPSPISEPIIIGIPTESIFKQFVDIELDPVQNTISAKGYAIDLFEKAVEQLPFYLPYEFRAFNGTYNALVQQIYLKVTNKTQTGLKLHSNLSRMALVVWLFMALAITQTYTANLSSILTVPKLEPAIDNVESIQMRRANIGYLKVTYVAKYLEEVLHFSPKKVKEYTSPEDSMRDLHEGVIAAVFMERPWAKILLARYCTGFTIAKQSFKVGGFGFVSLQISSFLHLNPILVLNVFLTNKWYFTEQFLFDELQAFAKGSPWLPYVTEALVKVTESGQLRDLEIDMIASQKCVGNDELLGDSSSEAGYGSSNPSLGADSFWMLFVFTAGTSTLALLMFMYWSEDELYDSSSSVVK